MAGSPLDAYRAAYQPQPEAVPAAPQPEVVPDGFTRVTADQLAAIMARRAVPAVPQPAANIDFLPQFFSADQPAAPVASAATPTAEQLLAESALPDIDDAPELPAKRHWNRVFWGIGGIAVLATAGFVYTHESAVSHLLPATQQADLTTLTLDVFNTDPKTPFVAAEATLSSQADVTWQIHAADGTLANLGLPKQLQVEFASAPVKFVASEVTGGTSPYAIEGKAVVVDLSQVKLQAAFGTATKQTMDQVTVPASPTNAYTAAEAQRVTTDSANPTNLNTGFAVLQKDTLADISPSESCGLPIKVAAKKAIIAAIQTQAKSQKITSLDVRFKGDFVNLDQAFVDGKPAANFTPQGFTINNVNVTQCVVGTADGGK